MKLGGAWHAVVCLSLDHLASITSTSIVYRNSKFLLFEVVMLLAAVHLAVPEFSSQRIIS